MDNVKARAVLDAAVKNGETKARQNTRSFEGEAEKQAIRCCLAICRCVCGLQIIINKKNYAINRMGLFIGGEGGILPVHVKEFLESMTRGE